MLYKHLFLIIPGLIIAGNLLIAVCRPRGKASYVPIAAEVWIAALYRINRPFGTWRCLYGGLFLLAPAAWTWLPRLMLFGKDR